MLSIVEGGEIRRTFKSDRTDTEVIWWGDRCDKDRLYRRWVVETFAGVAREIGEKREYNKNAGE